jgi:hypothetical protein
MAIAALGVHGQAVVAQDGVSNNDAAQDDAAQDDVAERYEAAKRRAADATYELRYRFVTGETLRWKVVHLATTETTIQGNTQTSQSRSVSTKVWQVTSVDPRGNLTLVHSVSDCDMWKKVSGRSEDSYNSRTDKTPPPDYEAVAETIGKPLSTITIDPLGNVVTRDDHHPHARMAHGQVTMPLPEGKIKPGHEWFAPDEVVVRHPDRRVDRIKTRQRYVLEQVDDGVATISVRTQVLSPVNDPKIRAQLLQQLSHGTVKFDVAAGRIVSRQLDWDETVIGFNGAESLLKFLARGTEELLSGEEGATPRTAAAPSEPKVELGPPPPVRRVDGAPIYKR